MARIIHWFRRDLRINDNSSLYSACQQASEVMPVYIVSKWKGTHPWTGANRQEFLCGCLESLARNLEQIGGRLIVRSGSPVEELVRLAHETRAEAIYLSENYSPYDRAIEKQLRDAANAKGIQVRAFRDTVILAPSEVLNHKGEAFRVFTPYAKAWQQHTKPPLTPKVGRLATPSDVQSDPLPTLAHWDMRSEAQILPAGEKAGRDRLKQFLRSAIYGYASQRSNLSASGTSRLSQDLRFGTISPREILAACEKLVGECSAAQRRGIHTFINELVWREFYFQILWHFPHVLDRDFRPEFSGLQWDLDPAKLQRWGEGLTGFPIVDAGMRELNATGYMHNRVRMIVAMFLTKDLHLDWRQGEKYFMRKLVDGDIPANNGGWQWSAGTGADAAPYFRIQNPWTQTADYDPDGEYIKRWVPELRDVDPTRFTRPPEEKLAPGYPLPMVDHARERQVALERFRSATKFSQRDELKRPAGREKV
ncbi:MAG: deoxyribodipyrimidine photo-lyase [Verrucomicrobia bacterium]|nr:deoxyribodipyrimidine photo-lyase [Verrucomicrobiota bacterium]MBV8274330.1 deoxyribodipyrimidine photo-lyase [Verrucomicrobiota bacterium]